MEHISSYLISEAVSKGLAVVDPSARIDASVAVVPYEDDGSSLGLIRIGQRCILRRGAILCSGVEIGADTVVGHNVLLRAGVTIGTNCVLSHGCTIERLTVIGNSVRISAQTHLTGKCIVEDDVQIGARVVTVNDNELRWGRSPTLAPPTFRRGARVGSGVTLLGGVEIGANAFVGAGALVTRSVPPRTLTYGVPAYVQGDAPKWET